MHRLVTSLLLLVLLGCSDTADRKALESVAVKRQQALTTKDLGLYISLISPAYQDKGKDFTAKRQELAATLKAFDRIDYRSYDRRIEIRGETATIAGSYGLKVTTQGKSLELTGKEELHLQKGPDGWKIVGGL